MAEADLEQIFQPLPNTWESYSQDRCTTAVLKVWQYVTLLQYNGKNIFKDFHQGVNCNCWFLVGLPVFIFLFCSSEFPNLFFKNTYSSCNKSSFLFKTKEKA